MSKHKFHDPKLDEKLDLPVGTAHGVPSLDKRDEKVDLTYGREGSPREIEKGKEADDGTALSSLEGRVAPVSPEVMDDSIPLDPTTGAALLPDPARNAPPPSPQARREDVFDPRHDINTRGEVRKDPHDLVGERVLYTFLQREGVDEKDEEWISRPAMITSIAIRDDGAVTASLNIFLEASDASSDIVPTRGRPETHVQRESVPQASERKPHSWKLRG